MLFNIDQINSDYSTFSEKQALGIHADCLEWMGLCPENSIHAIVTDPPYGVKEYNFDQLEKRETGNGGVWRIPPSFDGNCRAPLPRFTALNSKEINSLVEFFSEWSKLIFKILRPGGHVFIATNTFLSNLIFSTLTNYQLEYRGAIIRLVRTLRGGDRPKNAEKEFDDVCSMPRGCYEPWGLFRKPLPENMTVSDCLRTYETGGLRRKPDGNPFEDIIHSERTPKQEREIANHPSIKPQSFLRQIVYASLPLGTGYLLDPFMGSGSTLAAANAVGYNSIGIERHVDYFEMASKSVSPLGRLYNETRQKMLKLG